MSSVVSPIDDFPLAGVQSVHIQSPDFTGPAPKRRSIRWTEVFFLASAETDRNSTDSSAGGGRTSSVDEPVDSSRLAETLATAACVALAPHLDELKAKALTRIGLRVNINAENVRKIL